MIRVPQGQRGDMATKIKDYPSLLRLVATARPKGVGKPALATARSLLGTWVETAERHGVPLAEALRRIRDGAAARQIALSALETQIAAGQGIVADAACRSGCAFCCILKGEDGGTIGADEAARLHAALSPLAGKPDGRLWHPDGCPALDPETRTCRAYDARPMICRTYMSVDVAACEAIAEGTPAEGAGVLGAQVIHLSVLALSRAVLTGVAMVKTYSMASVARAAVEGQSLDAALAAASHGPRGLVDELTRQAEATRT